MQVTRSHFFPRGDADFDVWQEQFNGLAADVLSTHNADPNLIDALLSLHDEFYYNYNGQIAAEQAYRAAVQKKLETRARYEKAIREAARLIRSYPDTTPAVLASMGLKPAAKPRRRVGAVGIAPIAVVDLSSRLTHRLRIAAPRGEGEADASSSFRRALPDGTLGVEVRVTVVAPGATPPAEGDAYRPLMLSTNGRAEARFPSDDAGRTAVYMLRYVQSGGVTGPWSSPYSATIAA